MAATPASVPAPERRGGSHPPRRRWCLAPVLDHEPGERLEGLATLLEHNGTAALVLWETLRDLRLWRAAGHPPGALFTAAAAARRRLRLRQAATPAALEVSLASLLATLEAERPDTVLASRACLQVARWAGGAGAPATALDYAQAAAALSPRDAAPALAAGRYALGWQRMARAETWLRRAVGVARRQGQWSTYGEAQLALAELQQRQGHPEAARAALLRALRMARRHGLRGVRGAALHALMRHARDQGAFAQAGAYARAARRVLRGDLPRLEALAHDLAHLQLLRGRPARARLLLQRLLPQRLGAAERGLTLALLARAAAAERSGAEEAWNAAWTWIARGEDAASGHAPALLELARAAHALGDRHRSQTAARAAQAAASANGLPALEAEARALLTGQLRVERGGEGGG